MPTHSISASCRARATRRRRASIPRPPSSLGETVALGLRLGFGHSANLCEQTAIEQAGQRDLAGVLVNGVMAVLFTVAADELQRTG